MEPKGLIFFRLIEQISCKTTPFLTELDLIWFDLNFNKFQFKNALGGYNGHAGDGDKPAVFRSTLGTNFDSILNYEVSFQKGIAYAVYTTFRIGVNLDLGYLKKYFKK